MPTFPRGFVNYQANVANAELLEQLARETGGNVRDERTKLRMQHTASDFRTLRGIPAIGPGVSGAVRNTNPEIAAVESITRASRRGDG